MADYNSSHQSQVRRFGFVGILNTLIDYTIFIGLTKLFALPLNRVWIAKLVSGTVAMINSFYWNRQYVFRSSHLNITRQMVRFFLTTLVGVFVVQLGLTQLFASVWPVPGIAVYDVARAFGAPSLLPRALTQAFFIKTTAFGLATLASMAWNYLVYHHFVFKDDI